MAESVSRRKFLARTTAAIAAAIGAVWAVPAVAYVVSPAREKSGAAEWVPLGAADKVEAGIPSLFKTTITRTTGWVSSDTEVSIYVYTADGRTYQGFSNICTHLGCRVRWVTEREGYFCPCHNAVFNPDGTVATGPPPRPLDSYEIKVENGQIFVQLEV